MKISFSNIAWSPAENDAVVAIMHEGGITGVDIAPGKIFTDPFEVTDEEIAAVRVYWNTHHIQIAGSQSLHFGFPNLQLFGNTEQRREFAEHTAKMIRLLGKLGATAIVFGSPKNRVKGDLSFEEALNEAVPMMRELGQVAVESGTVLCVEPNATEYGCDFVTNTDEGIEFIEALNHPGVRLHLDTGTMQLMNEDIPSAIHKAAHLLHHFHVAEPGLEAVGRNDLHAEIHATAAKALREIGYKNWVTVEMKDGLTTPNTEAVETAVQFVAKNYLNN